MGIDVRRFIIHGVLKGYISRIHKYPILISTTVSPLLKNPSNSSNNSSSATTPHPGGYPLSRQLGTSSSGNNGSNYGALQLDHLPSIHRLVKYLNGRHHYDEICTLFGISAKEMDEVLKPELGIRFILR